MTEARVRRTNRRGTATRDSMLEAARKALATGDPGAGPHFLSKRFLHD